MFHVFAYNARCLTCGPGLQVISLAQLGKDINPDILKNSGNSPFVCKCCNVLLTQVSANVLNVYMGLRDSHDPCNAIVSSSFACRKLSSQSFSGSIVKCAFYDPLPRSLENVLMVGNILFLVDLENISPPTMTGLEELILVCFILSVVILVFVLCNAAHVDLGLVIFYEW